MDVLEDWRTGKLCHLELPAADAAAALEAVTSAGGRVVRRSPEGAAEVCARSTDPVGNVSGVHRQPGLAGAGR